jgi:hypothetical protein
MMDWPPPELYTANTYLWYSDNSGVKLAEIIGLTAHYKSATD